MKTKKREDRSASLAEFQPEVPVRRTVAQDLFDGIAPRTTLGRKC